MTTIVITGASSGIGEALALEFAAPLATLLLMGRDQNRLFDVKTKCEALGASVEIAAVDVTHQADMEKAILDFDQRHPVDMVIANAGISVGQNPRNREFIGKLFDVNVYGVLNTVMPLIPKFQERQRGHIAIMSSIVAFQVFPKRGEYAATKSAVRYLADAWRIHLKQDHIHVTSIHPGFVKTPLTDKNIHPMPGIVSAKTAAEKIRRGIERRKAVIAFPFIVYILLRFLQALPTSISDWIVSKVKT